MIVSLHTTASSSTGAALTGGLRALTQDLCMDREVHPDMGNHHGQP